MKYQITIGDQIFFAENKNGILILNGEPTLYNIDQDDNKYFIYNDAGVSTIQVVSKGTNLLALEVNGKLVEVDVQDHLAQMLEKLGIDNSVDEQINEVKAPMPGVILSILVEVGQEIKEGDPLLILEAMKMENMIKSPTDAIIDAISIEKGQSVEKNEKLISFD